MSSTSVPPPDDRAPDGAGAAPTAADPAPDGAVVSPTVADAPVAMQDQADALEVTSDPAGTPDATPGTSTPGVTPGASPGQPGAEEQAAEERRVADVVDPATVRQAPRIGRFILLGAVLGTALAAVLALATPASELDRSDLFWFLLLGLAPVGALTGAVVALVLDRRSFRARSARGAGEGARP
ncbi:hypothetical protein [Georgenia muralis]